jgi:hypothetical protein
MFSYVARLGLLILPFGILAGGNAAACGSGKLVFEDKFTTLDPAWAIEKEYNSLNAGPDGLTIVLNPGQNVGALNRFGAYKNFEICISTVVSKEAGSDDMFALRFWTPDGNDEYWAVAWVATSTFIVNRYVNNNPSAIISQTVNSSMMQVGGENEFSVSVSGNKGTFSINGKKLADFNGQPPPNGSIFGFNVNSGKSDKSPVTFVLKDLQLREVSVAQ